MVHHFKRGIIAGIILWILVFVEVSILLFGFNIVRGDQNYYFIHFILLTLFIIFVSLYYIKRENRAGFYEGLVLGSIIVIVTTVLDSFITVPLFIKDFSYFSDWDILTSGIMMLVIPGLISGIYLMNNSKKPKPKQKKLIKKVTKKTVKKTTRKKK